MILGAPWGSKGRSAVSAPWLPPAIWQIPRMRNLQNLQLKPKARDTLPLQFKNFAFRVSKLNAYGKITHYCEDSSPVITPEIKLMMSNNSAWMRVKL